MDALTLFAHSPVAFLGFGFQELLLVAFVALLVFGGNLPDVMRQLGRTYGKFRQSLNELSQPVRDEMRQVRRVSPPQRTPTSYSDEGPDADGDADTDSDATPGGDPESAPDHALEEGRGPTGEGADAGGIPRGGVSPGEAQSPDGGTSDEDDDDDEPPPV